MTTDQDTNLATAALLSPDARWLYMGRGEGGRFTKDGELEVFQVWWAGDGTSLRPPSFWKGGTLTIPGNLSAMQTVPRRRAALTLVALMTNGVPIQVHAPNQGSNAADEGTPFTTIGDLLPLLTEAVDTVGPESLADAVADGVLTTKGLEADLLRLQEALRCFRQTGWTVPLTSSGRPIEPAGPPSGSLRVLETDDLPMPSPGHYAAIQRALAIGAFSTTQASTWPRAELDRGKVRGFAELRRVDPSDENLLSPEKVEALAQGMSERAAELNDADADVLDLVSAIWLQRARGPSDRVVIDPDDLLEARGLQKRLGGSRRRGGFEPEQRERVLSSLLTISDIWVEIEDNPVGNRKTRTRRRPTVLRSRLFLITDEVGQRRLDGSLDVRALVVTPGTVLGRFLFGPGKQLALLSALALQYDPYRQAPEKRLIRYLSWLWRVGAKKAQFQRTFRVSTLLDEIALNVDRRNPARTRARFEKALDQLLEDGGIAAWQYHQLDEESLPKQRWLDVWQQARVIVEAPDSVRDAYNVLDQTITTTSNLLPERDDGAASLARRLNERRKSLRLSQLEAAERAGLSRTTFSGLERGLTTIGKQSKRKAEAWLSTSDPAATPT